MRVYAIGDIHGYLAELERAHRLIAADRARTGDSAAPVVHIGDLCDRGPDTRGVIDFILAGQGRGENWIALKGNHDRLMGYFLEQTPRIDPYMMVGWDWFHDGVGGAETLASYGIAIAERERWFQLQARAMAAVPEAHRRFVQSLPTSYETEDHIFVHAGIRPGIPLAEQDETDLVWIRHEFHDDPRDHGKLVVHGHTPVTAVTHYGNRVNIDTGAGYGKPIGVVVIEGREVWELTETGRVAVRRD
ncbi:metallophosphoesterase family protein [Sinisalibacter aestuarii]|uniref:Serine/threonine protein phosphatase n=1 Tax=Sinisalibacter aestuarii TaxID=2949426 RepID=A0ABQ5LP49_9RHOB|nr:metallophosphoesterase family protein [Sinisalibacter aestuarii]GKY86772.1 serine/threonine protein phosphatase [Sinisalibacter aestuarii]